MEGQEENNQWRYMKEMCILVDEKDNQIGEDTKKNCNAFCNLLHCRSCDQQRKRDASVPSRV